MRVIALLMMLASVAVGTGGLMEFVFFGPGTPQFTAGLIATPAGLAGVYGGTLLWRHGRRARTRVALLAGCLLAATVATTALDVMGPPATLIGLVGSLAPLGWALKNRQVNQE